MKIIDFMICSGTLSIYNYVLVENNFENIQELKEMGCSIDDISEIPKDVDNLIDIYPILHKKGYQYSPERGFFKDVDIKEKSDKEFFQTLHIEAKNTDKNVDSIQDDIIHLLEEHGYRTVGVFDTTEVKFSDVVAPYRCLAAAYKKHIEKQKDNWNYDMPPTLYKIYHQYSTKANESAVYILSEMSEHQIENIIAGISFYIEENTVFGQHYCLNEDMIAYLLCTHFNCQLYDKNKLSEHESYDSELDDIDENLHIDIFWARERSCGPDYKKTMKQIIKIKDSEYIKKLCAYFDDRNAFVPEENGYIHILSVEKILEKY